MLLTICGGGEDEEMSYCMSYFRVGYSGRVEIEMVDEVKMEQMDDMMEWLRKLEEACGGVCLVVDENAYTRFIQHVNAERQEQMQWPTVFQKYHSLQKAFSVHLVTLSSYNNNIHREHLDDALPKSSLDNEEHAQLLKFTFTLLKQGFKFLKPTSLRDSVLIGRKQKGVDRDEMQASSLEEVHSEHHNEEPQSVDTEVLRLRGLPWTSNSSDIQKFFSEYVEIQDPDTNILLVLNFHGRSTGEAYVRFPSVEDTQLAMKKDRDNIGTRYIELFPASVEEMEKSRSIMERELKELGNSSVVRMRGIPQGSQEDAIRKFFEGLDEKIVKTLLLPKESSRGPCGAYVEFQSPDIVDEALKRNKEKIGNRYIELFRGTKAEMSAAERYVEDYERYKAQGNPGVARKFFPQRFKRYKRKNRRHKSHHHHAGVISGSFQPQEKFSDSVVRLRGLPFNADEVDIADFFEGLPIVDQGIHFIYNSNDGKKTGEAYVEFATIDAKREAMKKDRDMMGKRYIEIFSHAPRHHNHHSHHMQQNKMSADSMQYGMTPQQYMTMMQQWYNTMLMSMPQQSAEVGEAAQEGDNADQLSNEVTQESGDASENESKETRSNESKSSLSLNANASEFVPDSNYMTQQSMMYSMMYQSMATQAMMWGDNGLEAANEGETEVQQQDEDTVAKEAAEETS